MRCNICDKELTDKEVVFNTELDAYEPCTTCLDIALDAAYSTRPDDDGLDDKFVLTDPSYWESTPDVYPSPILDGDYYD